MRSGVSKDFPNPDFALHADEAWAVANVAVEIGPILKHGIPLVDDFNQLVMDVFNLASGHLLTPGNVLTWNVWVDAPTLVDQAEWAAHAEYWRKSIDTGHGSPDGEGTSPRYFNGEPFEPFGGQRQEHAAKELELIRAFEAKHNVPGLSALAAARSSRG